MPTTILQWNCIGLLYKIPELKQWLLSNPVDVICIQESHLKVGTKCHLPGYTVVRKDRQVRTADNRAAAGGICFRLWSGLNHVELDCPSEFESQLIKVTTASGHLQIANVYLPPAGGLHDTARKAF